MSGSVIILAKRPRPGHVKTRLCPPCGLDEAAEIASASLELTIDAVAACGAGRCIVASDDDLAIPGFETIRQRGAGLDERLAGAFEDAGGPAFLVGMDTPQLTPRLLGLALESLARRDCVIGPTEDGGYWGIGLRGPRFRELFIGVPMSSSDTYASQRDRLRRFGLDPQILPTLRDVDLFEDARAVAGSLPGTRFARLVRGVERDLVEAG